MAFQHLQLHHDDNSIYPDGHDACTWLLTSSPAVLNSCRPQLHQNMCVMGESWYLLPPRPRSRAVEPILFLFINVTCAPSVVVISHQPHPSTISYQDILRQPHKLWR